MIIKIFKLIKRKIKHRSHNKTPNIRVNKIPSVNEIFVAKDNTKICAICWEEYKNNNLMARNNIYELPCNHTYHKGCIIKLICNDYCIDANINFKCPMCRAEFDEDQINITQTDLDKYL